MAATDIIIRPATVADVGTIAELWVELIDMHAALDSDFTRGDNAAYNYGQIILQHIVSKKDSIVLVAEKEGQLIGYALAIHGRSQPLFKITHYGEIIDFMVTSAHRRSGVGRLLYAHLNNWFKERNIVYVELRASIFNEESNPFWRRMGFTPTMYLMNKKG